MVDQQAIEIQEKTVKFNEMCVGKQLENDKITENLRVSFDEKLNKLQKKCNIQEKDIKNLHMLQKVSLNQSSVFNFLTYFFFNFLYFNKNKFASFYSNLILSVRIFTYFFAIKYVKYKFISIRLLIYI